MIKYIVCEIIMGNCSQGTISVKQKRLHDILRRQINALDLNQTFKVHVKAKNV